MDRTYRAFLDRKAMRAEARGLAKVPELAPHLFPFQAGCVDFSLRTGGSGCFLSTGLGKTECQLEFLQKSIEETNGQGLLLTPLAVAGQTKRRADRWGYEARVIRQQSEAGPGINIINYDRVDKIDPAAFTTIALDEASILKSYDSATRRVLTAAFRGHRFKLVATATPAPNDHMELGSYSDFLDILASNEMLSRFFINDTSTASQKWRLKGHAVDAFWDWLASWSRMAELPSDLGDSDEGYILPALQVFRHRARDSAIDRDFADLFGAPTMSATEMFKVKRQTSEARAEMAASIIAAEPDEPWVVWVDTNDEADAMKHIMRGTIEVRGSQSTDEKEEKLEAFSTGKAKDIIGKPSLMGFGLDWPHCARMVFVGRTFSYETWFQAVRRCWRFGQQRSVHVHVIVAEGETEIGRVIDRKAGDHARMQLAMRQAMKRAAGLSASRSEAYDPTVKISIPSWMR